MQYYHSRVADEDKKRISKAFYGDQSPIRIVVATEALGLGVDLPDIKRIVQYGVPKLLDMAVLWQRFGRVARGRGQRGDAGSGEAGRRQPQARRWRGVITGVPGIRVGHAQDRKSVV